MWPALGAAGRDLAAQAVAQILDSLLPPRCIGCSEAVDAHGRLCGHCLSSVIRVSQPCCRMCGLPVAQTPVADPLCDDCAYETPAFRTRAPLLYAEGARRLVLSFKHRGRLDGIDLYATWMAGAGADILAAADILAPVPLHWTRLLARGFNQSALLAASVAHKAGRRHVPDLLVRTRATRSQQSLDARQRARNITASAFEVASRRAAVLDGSRVVLVDDVLTTGSTSKACREVLLDAGAACVDLLVLARVGKDVDRLISRSVRN